MPDNNSQTQPALQELRTLKKSFSDLTDETQAIRSQFDADMALQLSQIIGTETETEENSQTEEQISGLRTLQESYSILADHCQTIVVDNTVLSQELEPGNIYIFTNRTNNLSITLATPEEGELAIYHLIIESGNTAPTLSFPVSVYWPGGDPIIGADERLEINILDNNALYILS